MIKKAILFSALVSMSTIFAMTVDDEVAAFAKRLEAEHATTKDLKKIELDSTTQAALINMCKEHSESMLTFQQKKRRRKKNKKKKVTYIPTNPHLHEIQTIYKKIEYHQKNKNLPENIKLACDKVMISFNRDVQPILHNKYIAEKDFPFIQDMKKMAQITLDLVETGLREVNREKLLLLKKAKLELRQKAAWSKIEEHMGQCTNCKKYAEKFHHLCK